MGQSLSRIQLRLALVVTASFAISPLLAYAIAISFGMLETGALLHTPFLQFAVPCYLLLVAWVAWYFHRFTRPILDWHAEHPAGQNLSESLSDHLGGYTTSYWSFFLIATLTLPTLQHWSGIGVNGLTPANSLLQFMLLHLVIAIYVGMPGYLYGLSTLGELNRYVGLTSVHVKIQTRMLLIGAYLPILTSVVLLRYYWWRTQDMPTEIFLAWTLIALVAISITVVAIHSLHQALSPVQRFISRSGASSNQQLANQLRPQSMDEIGYLTQMLRNLFKRLVDQESHVAAIVDNAAEGIIVLNETQEIDTFNPAAEQLFGFAAHEIRGKPLRWLLPDLDAATCNTDAGQREYEVCGRHRNGSSIPMRVRISLMQRDEQLFYTLLVADISERKAAEQRLMDAESRYRNLVETAHDLVWSIDRHGNWLYLNNAASQIYGYPAVQMIGHNFSEYQAPESREHDSEAFAQLLKGKELLQYETIHLDNNGQRRHISFNARPMFDTHGNLTQVSGTARDITDQKRFERELTYQAQHDTLTGLYNRSYFQSELERVISRTARNTIECALLYLDLDQFKYVNDTVGHAAGDRLLKECTAMLRKNIRDGDLLARFGGDEFTILLYDIDQSNVLPVAENIRAMLEHYRFMDSGKTFNITCSIGMTMIDNRITSADEAMARADLACNISKSQGRNCVHEYTEGDSEKSSMAEDMGWVARVRDAIDNDRFELHYQPIVALSSQEIHAYEVLLRLPTEEGKSIKPGGFIPAAERFGLIHHLDRWAVTHAMQYLAELHNSNIRTRFSINLSGRAVEDNELLTLIHDILKNTGLDPAALTFELTETAAIANLRAARKFITRLKDLGCHMALDDFGSGFCSFTYLKHLPVDSLKIDGAFVQGLVNTHVDQAMVQSMNQIAHALGKTTVAEFVENQETLLLLKEFGVDFAQGHYLGKPHSCLVHGVDGTGLVDATLSA